MSAALLRMLPGLELRDWHAARPAVRMQAHVHVHVKHAEAPSRTGCEQGNRAHLEEITGALTEASATCTP